MTLNTATQLSSSTVREVADHIPEAAPVFEKYGIDYCCKGHRRLDEVCAEKGLTVETIFRAIEQRNELDRARTVTLDHSEDSMTTVIERICSTHHAYIRNEIPRIEYLLSKVPDKHGPNHPELYRVRELFTALASELTVHLMKEEQILFPYLRSLERAAAEGLPTPMAMFGTVENPIRMMLGEHESAETIATEIREITNSYSAPEDACNGFRNLYRTLGEFEADLRQHIATENKVLFPRAIQLAKR